MRQHGIEGAKRRSRRWCTTRRRRGRDAGRAISSERDFSARPAGRVVGRRSDLPALAGRASAYLAFVLDAYSRRIVGWQLAANMRTSLVLDALRMALSRRQPAPTSSWCITRTPARSTRSREFQQVLDDHQVLASHRLRRRAPTTTPWPRASSTPSRPTCRRPRLRQPPSARARRRRQDRLVQRRPACTAAIGDRSPAEHEGAPPADPVRCRRKESWRPPRSPAAVASLLVDKHLTAFGAGLAHASMTGSPVLKDGRRLRAGSRRTVGGGTRPFRFPREPTTVRQGLATWAIKTAPLAADSGPVTPTRICRECQARFVPALQEQSRCSACIRLSRDLEIVDHYMRRAPGESIARIAIATGVAEDAIRAFADDGKLAQVPVDASAPTSCTLPARRDRALPGLPHAARPPVRRGALGGGLRQVQGRGLQRCAPRRLAVGHACPPEVQPVAPASPLCRGGLPSP